MHQNDLVIFPLKIILALGLAGVANAKEQWVGVSLELADPLNHSGLFIIVVDEGFDVVELHRSGGLYLEVLVSLVADKLIAEFNGHLAYFSAV